MRVEKKVIGQLEKCYSIAPLHYKGQDCLLVAAEKQNDCRLYDLDGNYMETVWNQPGGTMSMVQVPGKDGQFLATHKFYSPNDSADAKIVWVSRGVDGWDVKDLVQLPFVHRFDIVSRNGVNYLLACTLKSGHKEKDDWSSPGKVYAAVLPADLSQISKSAPLTMQIIKNGLVKNHGYTVCIKDGVPTSIVSAEQGVFSFTPPAIAGDDWLVEQLLDEATSDAIFCDMDGDDRPELFSFAPFHGHIIRIHEQSDDGVQLVYENTDTEHTDFLHAICRGEWADKPVVFAGHRKEAGGLYAYYYSPDKAVYTCEAIDLGRGPANVYYYKHKGVDKLIAANRETDEIALYTLLD